MPGISLDKVAELKRKMVADKDLSKIMEHFFDHFWEDPAFREMGRQIDPPKDLQDCVYRVIGGLFGENMYVVSILAVDLPGANLIHGAVEVSGDQGLFFWAPDLRAGIVSISEIKTGKTHFARISITSAEELKRAN